MNGSYLNKLLGIDAKHALYRVDGKWYHNLKKFPGVLFDKNGYVLFHSKEEYLNNSNLQRKKDLHITGGIESLKEYQQFSELEKVIIGELSFKNSSSNTPDEETIRVLRNINVIQRNQSLVHKLKKLYGNTCQICGTCLSIGKNKFYSEVHHIIPLGQPHNGVDRLDNMICVCPNHHVLLDTYTIPINIESLIFVKHNISGDFVQVHNSLVSF